MPEEVTVVRKGWYHIYYGIEEIDAFCDRLFEEVVGLRMATGDLAVGKFRTRKALIATKKSVKIQKRGFWDDNGSYYLLTSGQHGYLVDELSDWIAENILGIKLELMESKLIYIWFERNK